MLEWLTIPRSHKFVDYIPRQLHTHHKIFHNFYYYQVKIFQSIKVKYKYDQSDVLGIKNKKIKNMHSSWGIVIYNSCIPHRRQPPRHGRYRRKPCCSCARSRVRTREGSWRCGVASRVASGASMGEVSCGTMQSRISAV